MDKHTHELQRGDVVEVKRGKSAFTAPDGRTLRHRYDGYRPDRGVPLTVTRVAPIDGSDVLAVYFTDGSVAFAPAQRCSWYVHNH